MLRRAAAVAFAVAALSGSAYADARSESQLRQFFELIDGAEGWSARTDMILSEGANTIAEGILLTREAQPVIEIKIERLRLRDLDERDGGGFTASEIELTNAVASGADTGSRIAYDYSIPSATTTNVSMPAFTGVEYDPSRILTFWAKVFGEAAEGEFEEISIPSLVHETRSVGTVDLGTARTEQSDIRWTGLSGGIIASMSEGPMVFTMTGPSGEGEFRVASSSAENFSLAGFAHIFDETRYVDGRGDGASQPILSRFSMSGLSGSAAGVGTLRIDEIAAENIEAQQMPRPMTAEWDRLLDPAMPTGASADFALEAAVDMASSWRAGGIRLAGFSLDTPAENATASLGEMSFAALSSEGFDSFSLSSLSTTTPEASLSLASFDVSGFIFPDMKALMALAALEEDAPAETQREVILAGIAGLPRLAHLGLSELSAGPSPDQTISLASFSIDMAGWNDIWAESVDARIDDLVLPGAMLRENPESARIMDMMGFDRLVLDYTASDRWDPDQGTDNLTLGIAIQDVFDVELSYHLQGMTLDWMTEMTAQAGRTESSPEAVMATMQDLMLERASIQATDHTLLDRGFNVAAEMQGLSVDGAAYRQQMRGALPFLLSTVIPPDLARQISAPLQEFIGGGKTLVADLTPAAPMPVLEIIAAAESDPKSLPTLLGLQMRTEDAE